jgi:Ca2+-transporting ATPase
MAEKARAWHAMSVVDVAAEWTTDVERGLAPKVVSERRERLGLNELPTPPRPSAFKQLAAQFINPLVGTLLAAAVVAVVVAVTGEGSHTHGMAKYSDALAILLIVVVNAIIGFYQERRAEKALDALQRMAAPRCRVIRDGCSMTIDSVQLVPGDLVELAEGDQIPADLRLVETSSLEIVEGAFSGESIQVTKDMRARLTVDVAVADRVNMAFMGTTAVRGTGRGIVVATGAHTELGHIGTMLAGSEKRKSPLEERLDDFGTKILWLCVAISAALFVIGIVQGGAHRWHVLLLTAVSVAVAAIPEGLPAITTITLALGMQRMARHNAIVRKLAAVETLGSVRIICSDKTGTLTRNEMTVRALWVDSVDYDVSGEGYEGRGELRQNGASEAVSDVPDVVRRAVEIGVVANKAALESTPTGVRAVGDPTEGALLALGNRLGSPRYSTIEATKTAHEIPFDSDRKRMTMVLRKGERFIAHTKGAVERVLPLCTAMLTAQGRVPLDDALREAVRAKVDTLSSRALRVLALAEREGDEELLGAAELSDAQRAEHVERELVFVGLVGMMDPPRFEVKAALEECRQAHIRAVMITGDHQLTAEAIARELGMWEDGDRTVTGEDLERLNDQQLREIAHRVRVFARVSPEHKLRIVRAFQAPPHHEVVAMTGDGVNDAPAIKEAAIGVAMGKNGTDVAREAADMVLADDNFATIVEAVREGRAIFRNIQKSIFFLLSSNAGLCITVFVTSFFRDMPALSPLQILWINLVTNGLPALALGVDPPEADQMKEAPRAPGSPFLSGRDWLAILLVGILMAACTVVIYRLPLWPGLDAGEVNRSKVTMVFTVLAISPLFHAFNCRSQRASIFRVGWFSNRFLVIAVVVSAGVHALSLVVPPLQPVFRSNHTWTTTEILLVIGLSALPIPVIEVTKLLLGSVFSPPAPRGRDEHRVAATPR